MKRYTELHVSHAGQVQCSLKEDSGGQHRALLLDLVLVVLLQPCSDIPKLCTELQLGCHHDGKKQRSAAAWFLTDRAAAVKLEASLAAPA